MRSGHLTWPGDLTLRDLGLKFSRHVRKRCMIRCAAPPFLIYSQKTSWGGVQTPPPSGARVNNTIQICNNTIWYFLFAIWLCVCQHKPNLCSAMTKSLTLHTFDFCNYYQLPITLEQVLGDANARLPDYFFLFLRRIHLFDKSYSYSLHLCCRLATRELVCA